ncbi:MAG: hypothetical protein JW798_06185, partial [Prolixibacteraceae bacterium]|nr:hypothetical protein [Prolixibacteraceae bacterium]
MKLESGLSNTALYIFIFFIVAIALSYLIYFFRKDKGEFIPAQRFLLSVVRVLYTFLLAFLIISPVVELLKKRAEMPMLIVGIDNSESVANDTANIARLKMLKQEIIAGAGNKFDVDFFTFGNTVTQNGEITFTEKTSNYSSFINELEKRYFNLNVGAIILAGDGIYNEGINPVQEVTKLF